MKSRRANWQDQATFLHARKTGLQMWRDLGSHHSTLPLDCADEAIKYPKTIAMHGLPILARLSAVWILRKITEWLRLPFAADQIQQRHAAHSGW